MASISSMKTMEGACSSATLNSSRTSLGPSPRYFWISSEPTTRRKVADVWLATALASRVLPGTLITEVYILVHVYTSSTGVHVDECQTKRSWNTDGFLMSIFIFIRLMLLFLWQTRFILLNYSVTTVWSLPWLCCPLVATDLWWMTFNSPALDRKIKHLFSKHWADLHGMIMVNTWTWRVGFS